jgi:GNAT superfamily N-acetyltransferase
MTLQLVPLEEKHLDDAAALVALRYRALRRVATPLPSHFEEQEQVLAVIKEIVRQAPGTVALHKGRLVGFLSGWLLPHFRGQRALYSPEWANAANPADSRHIYEAMYASLAAQWVANGCFTHVISLFAHDHAGLEGWQWLGFGLAAVDAIRDLRPVGETSEGITLRGATLDDIETAIQLGEGLQRHLAAPPTFLPFVERQGRHYYEEWLAQPGHRLWLAYHGNEPIACLGQRPANPDACAIVSDNATTSIIRAYTKPAARGHGVATALLNQALTWARNEGYARCAVDFEPMNLLAVRFWLRHFQPVSLSLIRQVDQRIAWAHSRRPAEEFW